MRALIRALLCVCVASAVAVDLPEAGRSANPLNMRVYTQEFDIVYGSADDAARAEAKPAVLPDGKTWAFSGRWDDCNWKHLRMKELMSRYGYRATFYLNSGQREAPFGLQPFIRQAGRKLCADGVFTLGGHGLRHRSLPHLDRNELLFEILADKIYIEQITDTPVNSFCFAGSGFGQKHDLDTRADVAEAVIRAGYHHTPTTAFVRNEPGNASVFVSTVNLVVPGDETADPGKFGWQVEKYMADGALRARNPNMSIGIHVWHTEEGWTNLEACLRKYANRPDWWYCNQTEYAAHRYQSLHSRIEKVSGVGVRVRYRVVRPLPASLGGDVPLALEVGCAGVVEARAGGAQLDVKRTADRCFVNLPNDPAVGLPRLIDHIENVDNAEAPGEAHVSADFKGVSFFLHADEPAGALTLLARNGGEARLDRLTATLRLPLLYARGVQYMALEDLGPGASKRYAFPLGPIRDEPRYRKGSPYYVAQIDFHAGGVPGRVYATTRCVHEQDATTGAADAGGR